MAQMRPGIQLSCDKDGARNKDMKYVGLLDNVLLKRAFLPPLDKYFFCPAATSSQDTVVPGSTLCDTLLLSHV